MGQARVGNIGNIQGLRAIAATMVLLDHVPLIDSKLYLGLFTQVVGAFAYSGVEIFFVALLHNSGSR